MSEGEIWIKLFGLASLIISESFPLMWKFNVPELNFGNATCSISMSPATGSLLLCEEVLNLPCFSAALLETAKVLVFLLSLVFHVFGVLISLWLHTNAVGLPKGWKTAHIFAANLCYIHSWFLLGSICTSNDRVCKVPLQTKLKPTHHLVGGWQGQVRRCLKTCHQLVPSEMASHQLLYPD